MTIDQWCRAHRDVVVSISNPRSKEGYLTDIWMEDIGCKAKVFRELSGNEPATEEEVCTALDELYAELKEIIKEE
jgi:hypothetical protein